MMRFDKVIARTKRCNFLPHSVVPVLCYVSCYRPSSRKINTYKK